VVPADVALSAVFVAREAMVVAGLAIALRIVARLAPEADLSALVEDGRSAPAGTVLARDSGNGNKLVPVNDASGTSSITDPHAVLAHDVDATSADAEAIVYIHGHFNGAALTFGGDDTAADHKDALRAKGIFISNNLGA